MNDIKIIEKELKKYRVLLTSLDYMFSEYFLLNKTSLKEACTVTLGELIKQLESLNDYFPILMEKIRNHNVEYNDLVLNNEVEKTLKDITSAKRNIKNYKESIDSEIVWYSNHKEDVHDCDIRRLENEVELVNNYENTLNVFYNALNDFVD